MKRVLGALVGLTAVTWAAGAFAAPGKCLLVVKNKTYINGPCNIDRDADGSFRINVGDQKQASPYFVYANALDGGNLSISWNEDPQSTHAHTSLGETWKRSGSCWNSKTAKVCTWPAKR